MMSLVDFHVHSTFSEDGKNTVAEMAEAACRKGLQTICFTDHVEDCNRHEPLQYPVGNFFEKREAYFAAIREAKEAYAGKVEILTGIELGGANHNPELAAKIAATPGLDFIIGSVHNLRGRGDFYHWPFRSEAECLGMIEEYIHENLELIALGFQDVIGHLGYPSRYMFEAGYPVYISAYPELLRQLLSRAIEAGKGFEINTAGFRKPIAQPAPDLETLKLYRSMGGEIITVGADGHDVTQVGYDTEKGFEILREAGFKYITVFRERKPHFIKI